jgi:hypothetical protein
MSMDWTWTDVPHGILVYAPPLLLTGTAVLLFFAASLSDNLDKTSRIVSALTAIFMAVIGIGTFFATPLGRPCIVLSLLPCILITQNGAMAISWRRPLRTAPPPSRSGTSPMSLQEERMLTASRVAQQKVDDVFGPVALGFFYGVPGLLTAVILALTCYVLFPEATPPGLGVVATPDHEAAFHAARFGAAGAYVYVMLYLGQRAMRKDVTSGAAVWSVVSLALGPLVAALVAMFWTGKGAGSDDMTREAVFFIAGFSPRWIVSVVEEIVHRLFTRGGTAQLPNRILPLNQLRGITTSIEERLGEENIGDVNAFAMADPIKLFRNTNFPKRLILDWIDEAQLIVHLPESWQSLERLGIAGAIDLAALVDVGPPGPASEQPPSVLAALSQAAKIDEVILRSLAVRLAEDVQVQLIWFLYQYEEGLTPPMVSASRAPEAPAAGSLPSK